MLTLQIAVGVFLGGLALWAVVVYRIRQATRAQVNERLKQVAQLADEHVSQSCASSARDVLDVFRGRLATIFDDSVASPKAAAVAEFDVFSDQVEQLKKKLSREIQDSLKSQIATLEEPGSRAMIHQRIENGVATSLQPLWDGAALLLTNELASFNDETKPSITKDHPRKLCMLGNAYRLGEGVEQDREKSMRLLRQSAEKAYAPAQAILGNAYLCGEGVQEDFTEALKWLRLAAQQNDAFAQNALGLTCANGIGVKQDFGEALKWYQLAASQGFAAALNNIGALYYEGKGVPKDLVRARMWFVLAAERGEMGAIENAEAVSKEMSPVQISESDELARRYDPSASRAK